MKKLLTLLLSAVVVFSLMMPVFAQDTGSQEAPKAERATKAKKVKKAKLKKAKKAKKEGEERKMEEAPKQ